jgi:hypothetical protein
MCPSAILKKYLTLHKCSNKSFEYFISRAISWLLTKELTENNIIKHLRRQTTRIKEMSVRFSHNRARKVKDATMGIYPMW